MALLEVDMGLRRNSSIPVHCNEEASKASCEVFTVNKTNASNQPTRAVSQSPGGDLERRLADEMSQCSFFDILMSILGSLLHFTSQEFPWATSANEFQAFKCTNTNIAFAPFLLFFSMIYVVR